MEQNPDMQHLSITIKNRYDMTMIYININIKYTFIPQLKNFYRNNQ